MEHLTINETDIDARLMETIFDGCKRLISFKGVSCNPTTAAFEGLVGIVHPCLETFFLQQDELGLIPSPSILRMVAAAFPNLRTFTPYNIVHVKDVAPTLSEGFAKILVTGCPLLQNLSLCWVLPANTLKGKFIKLSLSLSLSLSPPPSLVLLPV